MSERLFQREHHEGNAWNEIETILDVKITALLKTIYDKYSYIEPYDLHFVISNANNFAATACHLDLKKTKV